MRVTQHYPSQGRVFAEGLNYHWPVGIHFDQSCIALFDALRLVNQDSASFIVYLGENFRNRAGDLRGVAMDNRPVATHNLRRVTYNYDLSCKHLCASTRVIFHIGDNHTPTVLDLGYLQAPEVDSDIVSRDCLLETLGVSLDAIDLFHDVDWCNVELALLVQMQGFCDTGLDPPTKDRANSANFATLVQRHT